MAEEQAGTSSTSIELATELTIAWLSNPNVRATAEEVPAFLRKMHETIGELSKVPEAEAAPAVPEHVPAVPIRSSVKPDFLVSLIDGRKLKSLKRHLSTHGLTPAEYRERYGLKPDYPMVAPNYSAQRRAVAQRLGLGRKARGAAVAASEAELPAMPQAAMPETAAPAPTKRRRRAAAKPAGEAKATTPKRTPRAKKAEVPVG